MKIFIAAIFGIMAFECLAKVFLIARADDPPPRTKPVLAFDLVFTFCLLIWASVLLWGDA